MCGFVRVCCNTAEGRRGVRALSVRPSRERFGVCCAVVYSCVAAVNTHLGNKVSC